MKVRLSTKELKTLTELDNISTQSGKSIFLPVFQDNVNYYKLDIDQLQDLISGVIDAIDAEVITREQADEFIRQDLIDETSAREVADELLQDQINEVAQARTDWEENDPTSMSYLVNRPVRITDTEIEALFV